MKKERKPVVEYLISSLVILAVSLIFSIISIVFFADTIPGWVQFLVSFVFIAPIWFLTFTQGKGAGEKLYKKRSETSLNDIHRSVAIDIPYYKCIYHVLVYAVPLLILTILCVILDNVGVHLAVALFIMPITLMFSSINVIAMTNLNFVLLIIYVLYILIISGAFILGFFLKIAALRRQQRDIENELRQFNN